MSDTQRTATEQLLISNAVDQAVSHLDFRPLAGKKVYCDAQFLDGTVDRGYVVSSLRQQLLASGCTLLDDRAKAVYVVELRSGGIGTDHHSLLVGVPQMTVPAFVPGQPSQIPEIPVAKKNDERGVAKIAAFAYNRLTGQRVWQSGTVEGISEARDTWIAGMGPFRAGTIVHGTALAGEELPNPLHHDKEGDEATAMAPVAPATATAVWAEPAIPPHSLLESFTRATLGQSGMLELRALLGDAPAGKSTQVLSATSGTATSAAGTAAPTATSSAAGHVQAAPGKNDAATTKPGS